MKSKAGKVSASSHARSDPRAIVGIGASAGGLEAFTQLLNHLAIDTGMGFVLVQHLAPAHQSVLPELLRKATRMPVTSVKDRMRVRPNEVYVIPPNRTMTIAKGVLRLVPRDEKQPYRPIDEFFRSLGDDQKNRGIGVVLSGTASDGTIGVESIKAQGGITFAQDASAKYDSMPRNAIAAGHVDFVLPPDKIAEEIALIGRHPYVLSTITKSVDTDTTDTIQNGNQEILRLLRKATGLDFTYYRANTLTRRIVRRMILHHVQGVANYATYLRNHPAEAEALTQDLLISVTSFFRNPEVFDALKKEVFPQLLRQHETDQPLRFWVSGCSTGQEAYSMAMNFMEFAEDHGSQIPIQIYATDLNAAAIDKARHGAYSKSLVNQLSPQRLRRFFVETEAGYRVNDTVREMCIFARHNLMTDPPFSRMDLISCRNVLIYMEPVLQRSIIPMFHYALKPTGVLLLGLSETIGSDTDLFVRMDKKCNVYARKPVASRAKFGITANTLTVQRLPSAVGERPREVPVFDAQKEGDRILLAQYTPASVLVNSRMDILQVRGSTGAYLEAPAGKATHNVLKMAREDLMLPLQVALRQAAAKNRRIQTPSVRFKHDGQFEETRIEVVPIRGFTAQESYFLILFHSAIDAPDSALAQPIRKTAKPTSSSPSSRGAKRPDESRRFADLRQQFESSRKYSKALLEQQEAYAEELQSANEELQSTNEELQSLNEELETAKEELQSGNEELTTINEEMENRNRETHQLNADLTNLLACVRMPILMTDRDLRIRFFSPSAAKTLNLIDSDVGRPITNLNLGFQIPNLSKLQTTIDRMNDLEHEVQDRNGHWYKLYIGPYKTPENRIDGVMIVLTDIQALKETERSISAARRYAESIVETVPHPLVILDDNFRVKTANRSYYELFQVSRQDIENQLIYDIGNKQWNIPELRKLVVQVLLGDGQFKDFEVQRDFPRIGSRTMLIGAQRLQQHQSQEHLILLAIEDITERKVADAERSRIKEERAARAEAEGRAKDEFLAMMSHELRAPLNSIFGWSNLLNDRHLSDADRTRALESIERNARIQTKLIEDLIDASSIAAGKLHLERQEVDLPAIVEAAIDTVRQAAAAKKIQIVFNAEQATGPVWGDPQRLQQVLWNLLSNAVKFTPPEGRVDIRLDWTDSGVRISVTDTGQGIKAEFMPYLFERFRQADSSTTRKHGGLGLGLSIARTLVEMHGGTIWAESQGEGQGSTLIVQLPLRTFQPVAIAPELPSRRALEQSQPPVASLQNVRVLVLDDEDDTRNLLTAVFRHYDAEVKTAASVAEALEMLTVWKPAVMVCDIAMPGQDGYTFIRKVRELLPEQGGQIPAVVFSAYGKEEDHRRALKAGFQAHLTKPASPAELVSLVSRLANKPDDGQDGLKRKKAG